ncbi:Benzylsuccinate synthase alpha subunit [Anaerohalosphaera lusitana]|uniref:Benzylsuccinate synthase alpha subunit n=1 Tax=Anaerohalosphaera lusitana TaxID=1936003 RepID=A0A1U9NQS9_9BACT|nr:trans-4-hydroxy-L-proline dehydratase [Anaerohalosphaera lusitana]AQT70283.1 Benzylsuccinate synthase alpha subunit [Anaerohalosphaera lusitana]
MNDRVRKLREQSVNTKPFITAERAELVTDFYKQGKAMEVSAPMCRALAFKHLMENKAVCINPGELIVGERGPAPKATPTYPELCCHSLDDFAVLESRDRTPFAVSAEVKKVYAEKVIPFWRGKTMREKVFGAMTEEWNKAFEAGVFTEFMEQRAPGHAILDDKIYKRGLAEFKADIRESLGRLDFLNDPDAYDKSEELKAMAVCIDAVITFANRYADEAVKLAAKETDEKRKMELEKIAEVCRWVPENAPRDFHEALQAYWFVHLGVITELNTWDSYNPGRIDQHLWPFYKEQVAAGTLDEEGAKELLGCFWVKFNNQPAPPKVGITEEQSGTYTDFALINVGGVDPATGADAVNDLSYIVLDVVKEMQLVQPSSCIQISKKNPNRFLKRACEVVKTGLGQPSIFNTDVIIREMLHDGKNMADARSGGPSGCVTISAFGKESCTLTGYCNWPKIFELTLNNGVDPRTGEQVGLATGEGKNFGSFEQLMEAYKRQLRYFVDLKIRANNVIERLYANYMPSPFMSVLVDDCIERGLDYHDGGPRYNVTYIQGVGIGSLTDSMAAVKKHVYDDGAMSMKDILGLLECDFEGAEDVRQKLLNASPKYGNDDEYADGIAEQLFEAYFDVLDGRRNTKGGYYRVNLLPTTAHIYFGSVTGALPSGRKAGVPLSDGISPSQGIDTHGPTGVVKSAARIDHSRTGGTLLNMKFNPQVLEGEGLDKLCHLVRAYFKLDGHHIQFNVVDSETLREAQKQPDEYRDLIVRVAGYSDYFVDLGRDLQNEIIARTEQQSF